MKRLIFKYLSLILISSVSIAQETASGPSILDYIQKNLPCEGTLKNLGGFVYLDLDDRYVHELIQFIKEEGCVNVKGKISLRGGEPSVICDAIKEL